MDWCTCVSEPAHQQGGPPCSRGVNQVKGGLRGQRRAMKVMVVMEVKEVKDIKDCRLTTQSGQKAQDGFLRTRSHEPQCSGRFVLVTKPNGE